MGRVRCGPTDSVDSHMTCTYNVWRGYRCTACHIYIIIIHAHYYAKYRVQWGLIFACVRIKITKSSHPTKFEDLQYSWRSIYLDLNSSGSSNFCKVWLSPNDCTISCSSSLSGEKRNANSFNDQPQTSTPLLIFHVFFCFFLKQCSLLINWKLGYIKGTHIFLHC